VTEPASDTGTTPPGDITGTLIASVTTVMVALTAVGGATGLVGKMFRNESGNAHKVEVGIVLAFVCGLAGVLIPTSLSMVRVVFQALGGLFLASALLLALWVQTNTFSLSDRPVVTATVGPGPNGQPILKADVKSSGAKASGQLLVVVQGEPSVFAKSGEPVPPTADTLYYSKSGPTTDGDLTQDLSLPVNANQYQTLRIYTAVYANNELAPIVDCDHNAIDDHGRRITDNGQLIETTTTPAPDSNGFTPPLSGTDTHSVSSNSGCVSISVAVTSSTTTMPTATTN